MWWAKVLSCDRWATALAQLLHPTTIYNHRGPVLHLTKAGGRASWNSPKQCVTSERFVSGF